jgi:Emfourin
MRVEVTRSGGFAGVRVRGVFDTSELAADAAAQADSLVRQLAARGPSSSAPPPHPDAFQYQLRALDQDQSLSVMLNESDVPGGLRDLIDGAIARGNVVD